MGPSSSPWVSSPPVSLQLGWSWSERGTLSRQRWLLSMILPKVLLTLLCLIVFILLSLSAISDRVPDLYHSNNVERTRMEAQLPILPGHPVAGEDHLVPQPRSIIPDMPPPPAMPTALGNTLSNPTARLCRGSLSQPHLLLVLLEDPESLSLLTRGRCLCQDPSR